jgi:hypothetical protein
VADGRVVAAGSLPLFTALQFAWILLATLGLWANARETFGEVKIDEQVWMFGITLPLTLVSIRLARVYDWKMAPVLIGISTGLHVLIYFMPLFFLMGAHMNSFALKEYAVLIALFAALYACVILPGQLVLRFIFRKEPAT